MYDMLCVSPATADNKECSLLCVVHAGFPSSFRYCYWQSSSVLEEAGEDGRRRQRTPPSHIRVGTPRGPGHHQQCFLILKWQTPQKPDSCQWHWVRRAPHNHHRNTAQPAQPQDCFYGLWVYSYCSNSYSKSPGRSRRYKKSARQAQDSAIKYRRRMCCISSSCCPQPGLQANASSVSGLFLQPRRRPDGDAHQQSWGQGILGCCRRP